MMFRLLMCPLPHQKIVLEGSIQSKVTVTYLKSKLSALNFLFEVEGQIVKATIMWQFNNTSCCYVTIHYFEWARVLVSGDNF